jgi:hypothetical protein
LYQSFLFHPGGLGSGRGPLLAIQDNAILRVDRAWQHREISLKQAVMLKADILFNPKMIPDSSPFRPGPGETYDVTDFSAFYANVFMVHKELSASEKAYLAALDPELKRVLAAAAAGQPPFLRKSPEHRPSASDRVIKAAQQGKISRKEAVLLQAQLRFAPQTVANPEFQVHPGEVAVSEPCDTAFFKDVNRVFNELTPGEREYLKSLAPDIKDQIEGKEEAAGQKLLNYKAPGTGPSLRPIAGGGIGDSPAFFPFRLNDFMKLLII